MAKVQSARRVVRQSVSRKVRDRAIVNQEMDFKTSSWYQKAALSISVASHLARKVG
jgi:hypothetical protein